MRETEDIDIRLRRVTGTLQSKANTDAVQEATADASVVPVAGPAR